MSKVKARNLRKNMTDAERKLWSILRSRKLGGWKFRRQHPLGPYVLDFACLEQKVVIEADGGQHAGSQTDKVRTAWLEKRGWTILRFWNNEILNNIAGVAETIMREMSACRN